MVAALVTATNLGAAPDERQWHLESINVSEAQRASTGDGVTIGLLTGGLPVAHPDLGDAVLPTVRRAAEDLFGGFEQVGADYPGPDDYATGELGLMVAQGGSGLLGVAPGARVQPVICTGLPDDTAACIRWLVDSGADVIDLATAPFPRIGNDFEGIRYALAHDVVVVAALSEGAQMPRDVTAGVILVGGVDRNGNLPPNVLPNGRVSIRAPGTGPSVQAGDEIIGLVPGAPGGHGTLRLPDGDEVAAALVTGVVALVRSKYPELKGPSVINRILLTAADRDGPGRDGTYGYGIVDAAAAVTDDVPEVRANPLGEPGSSGGNSLPVIAVAVGAVILAVAVVTVVVVVTVLRRRRRVG
nr:hypothetical protein Ade03nite_75650 [Actinoplanes derwentensis]